jgi:hypothetical protein
MKRTSGHCPATWLSSTQPYEDLIQSAVLKRSLHKIDDLALQISLLGVDASLLHGFLQCQRRPDPITVSAYHA